MSEIDPETLDYSEVTSALYEALEADLSSKGWPRNSRAILQSCFEELDHLISLADG